MKTQIRRNIFETNSSSVHAITVTKNIVNPNILRYNSIEFSTGEFGWEHRTYYNVFDKASYLWTAIVHNFIKEYVYAEYDKDHNLISEGYIVLDTENENYIEIREAIRTALINAGIEDDGWNIRFQENFHDDEYYGTSDGGYIDHCPSIDFVEEIVFNEDRLIRYLFSDDSKINTWNDNEWYYDKEDDDDDTYPEEIDWDNPESTKKYHEWHDNHKLKYFGINPNDKTIEWKYIKSN